MHWWSCVSGENPRAEEALGELGIELEEGQVLLTRKNSGWQEYQQD